jgi:hypothetical protein
MWYSFHRWISPGSAFSAAPRAGIEPKALARVLQFQGCSGGRMMTQQPELGANKAKILIIQVAVSGRKKIRFDGFESRMSEETRELHFRERAESRIIVSNLLIRIISDAVI